MNIERFYRLVSILDSGNYEVDLKNLQVISKTKGSKSYNKPMKQEVTNAGRLRIRLTYNSVRYEYELHEIITVKLGKYIVGMRCSFIDGNNKNCHPGNLYWSDKAGGRIIINRKKSKSVKISDEDVKFIRDVKLTKNRCNGSNIKRLADFFGVSESYIKMIRGNKARRKIKTTKENKV